MTNPNDSVVRVNGSGQKVGPNILLKVMSGDKVDIAVQYYFNNLGTPGTPVNSFTDVLNALATGIYNMTAGSKGVVTDLTNPAGPVYAGLNSFLTANEPTPGTKPKAYLNWILLDEQMKYVNSYPQSGAAPVATAGTNGGVLQAPLGYTGIPITKNGYLYIWVSNETPSWDVFFDNLSIKHYAGPLLEETHYYPYGLTMAGISSKALKTNYSENKYKYNSIEFNSDFDLNIFDAHVRNLDPQLGRFWQLDPKLEGFEQLSPYIAMLDNPIRYSDPLGDSAALFRPDGSFWKFADDGKKEWSGTYYQKSTVTSTFEKDGVKYEVRTYSEAVNFQFNDPEADIAAIRNGIENHGETGITGVELMSDDKVNKQIDNSDVNSPEAQKSPLSYAKNQPTGKMDYGVKGIASGDLSSKKFYIREGIAYNVGDIGNYLWGWKKRRC